MKKVAVLTWENEITQEAEIDVGTHTIHFGGAVDGYCYQHNSWDCKLTEEEKEAIKSPVSPEEYDDRDAAIYSPGEVLSGEAKQWNEE